jgi:hypothetical protein
MNQVGGSFQSIVPIGRLKRFLGWRGPRGAALAMCVLAMVSVLPLHAAVADDDAAPAGAGNTRALRLSSVDGQVRVEQDGQILADPALANMPLFAGTQITTGNDGRAEIQMEDGSVARLSPNSTLTLPVVEKQGAGSHTEVVLNNGLAYFELQPSTSESSLRVSYGSASFAATSFSVIRVALDTPPGDLAVFSGNVHLDRGNALQLDVHGGETLTLDAGDTARYSLRETIQPDSWDTWNADRDQVLNSEASQQTAASGGASNAPGMADLDANGNWYDVPGQGYVWSPYDAQAQGASWDPYGFGHWVYYPRFGFVWVSGYGWGYAAFDCGTWNYFDTFGWGWAPGGGCNPWWGGYGGWGYNVGIGPRGYHPPGRPIRPPLHPHPVGGRTLVASNVIAVDKRVEGGTYTGFEGHPKGPVTIAGHLVEPLQPVAPRQHYDLPGSVAAAGRTTSGYFPAPSHPASAAYGGHPVTSGARPAGGSAGHASYSGGGSSGGASHAAPSGGGGGGGGHASGGGGGSHH